MAPSAKPTKSRTGKHGQGPLHRRNEVSFAVQHAAAVRGRRQPAYHLSLRPELDATPIPGLLGHQCQPPEVQDMRNSTMDPIPGLQPEILDVAMELSLPRAATPQSHIQVGNGAQKPSGSRGSAEHSVHAMDSRSYALLTSLQRPRLVLGGDYSSPAQERDISSAPPPIREEDAIEMNRMVRDRSRWPQQSPNQPPAPVPTFPRLVGEDQGSIPNTTPTVGLRRAEPQVLNELPTERNADPERTQPSTPPGNTTDQGLYGRAVYGSQGAITPGNGPHQTAIASVLSPTPRQTPPRDNEDAGVRIDDLYMSDSLYGEVHRPPAPRDEPHSRSFPAVAKGMGTGLRGGAGGAEGEFDHDSDYDLVMDDDHAPQESDSNDRISALEHQFELQQKDMEVTRKKLESTEGKIDLLCTMVARLGEGSRGGQDPASQVPTTTPDLVVVGSQVPVIGVRRTMGKQRARGDLIIQKAIDTHWDKLMLTYELPQEALVKGYALENGRACSVERFQPDYRAFVKSAWNVSVVETFVESFFAANHPDIPRSPSLEFREKVERFAFSQLKTWRSSMLRNPKKELDRLKAKRRYERRRQSFLRRRNVAATFPDTRRHVDMINYLGPGGMSSDESDHETSHGLARYRIKAKRWRHPSAELCLRVLDALHRNERFQKDKTAGPGARVHLRAEGGEDSTRRARSGLPSCLYNPELLNATQGARLRAVPSAQYDWGHTEDITELAAENNGDASQLGSFPAM